jgi:hypothetical protein
LLRSSGERRLAAAAATDELGGMADLADLMRAMAESSAAASAKERATIKDPGLQVLADMFPTIDMMLITEVFREQKGNVEAATAILLGEPTSGPLPPPKSAAPAGPVVPLATAAAPRSAELSRLLFIFPSADVATLETALRDCRGNVEQAVAWLLGEAGPVPPEPMDDDPSVSDEMRRLMMMFPKASKGMLQTALTECENDMERAVAWLLGEPHIRRPAITSPPIEPDDPGYDDGDDPGYVRPPMPRGPKLSFKIPPRPKINWKKPAQSLLHGRGFEQQIQQQARSSRNPEWLAYVFESMIANE